MLHAAASSRPDLAVTRVRRAVKLRLGKVIRVHAITPTLVRITLAGDDLRDFDSASFDDHVKVFFPAEGEEKPLLPGLGPDGPTGGPAAGGAAAAGAAAGGAAAGGAASPRPLARDFTPRRFDNRLGELDIEFALHATGVATTWASRARVGHYLGIGGPRGSMIIPTGFDWHLLIGDDTALPAIARRLEELPPTAQAIVVAEVADAHAELDLQSRASLRVTWCHRDGGEARSLLAAVSAMPALPEGEGYAWAAAESAAVRRIREHLVSDRGMARDRVRAAAYWKLGTEAVHEVIGD
jgi:NADPH-dependent ferric siderophore reductase